MITMIEQRPTGATFEDWQDLFHESLTDPVPIAVGNYRRDGLEEEDEYYLDLEAQKCGLVFFPVGGAIDPDFQPPSPHLIQARGVGNWRDPDVIVICEKVESPCKSGGRSPKWDAFPNYRRLRPFSGSSRSRKFLYKLLSHAGVNRGKVYVTAAYKGWLDPAHSGICLKEEMMGFLTKGVHKVIALGPEAAQEYQRWVHLSCPILYHPEFWTGWHQPGWQAYRDEFKRIVDQ